VTLSGSVGVVELGDPGLSVFPNPADDRLQFTLSEADGTAGLQVDLLDNSGRLVQRSALGSTSTVSTATLVDGLYMYRLHRNGDELARGRFVVLHGRR
jgi:hypothetical protein